MNIDDFHNQFSKYSKIEKLEDSLHLIDVYIEFMFRVIVENHGKSVNTIYARDSLAVFQMIFSKLLHLKKLLSGVSYVNRAGDHGLNTVLDPTVIAVLIRNIFETVCTYHIIYSTTKNDEELLILYNLWAHAGLKYRSRFDKFVTLPENQKKLKDEQEQMGKMIEEIKSTKLYNSLSEKDQGKIQTKLKEKDYKILFGEDGKVNFLNWQQITEVMGLNKDLFDQIYTFFSLYAHPSNVSVFQFSDIMASVEDTKQMTNFNLRNVFVLLSTFISDYIKYHKEALETYRRLPFIDQVLIDCSQTFMRGEEYSIDDIPKKIRNL